MDPAEALRLLLAAAGPIGAVAAGARAVSAWRQVATQAEADAWWTIFLRGERRRRDPAAGTLPEQEERSA